MKYVCDACSRLVNVGRFSVGDEALVLVCPVCGGSSRARSAMPAVAAANASPEPKRDLAPADSGQKLPPLPPELDALWQHAEAAWSEEARHDAFLAACGTPELLAEAVRRYRAKLDASPEDPVAARLHPEAIRRLMALCAPLEEPTQASAGKRVATVLVLAVTITLLFSALYLLLQLSAP